MGEMGFVRVVGDWRLWEVEEGLKEVVDLHRPCASKR